MSRVIPKTHRRCKCGRIVNKQLFYHKGKCIVCDLSKHNSTFSQALISVYKLHVIGKRNDILNKEEPSVVYGGIHMIRPIRKEKTC